MPNETVLLLKEILPLPDDASDENVSAKIQELKGTPLIFEAVLVTNEDGSKQIVTYNAGTEMILDAAGKSQSVKDLYGNAVAAFLAKV